MHGRIVVGRFFRRPFAHAIRRLVHVDEFPDADEAPDRRTVYVRNRYARRLLTERDRAADERLKRFSNSDHMFDRDFGRRVKTSGKNTS